MKKLKNLQTINISNTSRILVVIPHPDDETGYMSGIIQRIVKKGAHVKVICVTDGCKSTLRYGLRQDDVLTDIREEEFKRAMQTLGITDYIKPNFPDGGVMEHEAKVSQFIKNEIIEFRPSHILTLEPDGIYGHTDHIAVSAITAKLAKEGSDISLLYATVGNDFYPEDGCEEMAKKEIHPMIPEFYIRLTIFEIAKKLKGFRDHKSQFKITPGFLLYWYRCGLLTKEYVSMN